MFGDIFPPYVRGHLWVGDAQLLLLLMAGETAFVSMGGVNLGENCGGMGPRSVKVIEFGCRLVRIWDLGLVSSESREGFGL